MNFEQPEQSAPHAKPLLSPELLGRPRLRMVVVCRSPETAGQWRERATVLDGLEIVTELGCQSYYQLIARIIASEYAQPVLLCHDDIWCGLGFATAVHDLLDELARDQACWGVCGNAGISWDGRQIFRYIKDPHGGPQHGLAPEPVLGIDGNLMLLNVPALAAAGVAMPSISGFHGYDIVLSLESLRSGLSVLCDRRLFVMHLSGGDNKAFQCFIRTSVFQEYLVRRFLNHSLPTINGWVDTSERQDYRYLELPGQVGEQQDVVALFDRALAARRRPSVTIGCRTQFNRPELLTRAVASFAVAAQQAPELVEFKVRIVSDQPAAVMEPELARLRRLFPGLDLDGWVIPPNPRRFSRTEVLLGAVERAATDYLWFVDDDDFVLPSAIRPLARALAPGIPRLVVGNSLRTEEDWGAGKGGAWQLKDARPLGRYVAEGVFLALAGDNHTPICSMLFPVETLRDRVAGVAARGDYYEDYFLLLLVLSAARVEVRTVEQDFCTISLRTGENTVTQPSRDHWNLSYATFVSEVLRHPEATSPFLWQLSARMAGRISPETTGFLPPGLKNLGLGNLFDPAVCRYLARRFFVLWKEQGVAAAARKAWRYFFAGSPGGGSKRE
ncbi:MAG: glycosyltransferase [Deltaproteobacteria bacterium]|nr:glycosyltransferase [Deltaproteobacteria bacterium]